MSLEVPKSFLIENINIIKQKAAQFVGTGNWARTAKPVHRKAKSKEGVLDPSKCWVWEVILTF